MPPWHITTHDSHPSPAAQVVDEGIGTANDAAAPLYEVQPLSCFAHDAAGQVIGGAVGRRWGSCCELQQLWVEPSHRRQGLASALLRSFEAQARAHGCVSCFLETFSFQAPAFYRARGYAQDHALTLYPHGIVKFLMIKPLAADTLASPGPDPT